MSPARSAWLILILILLIPALTPTAAQTPCWEWVDTVPHFYRWDGADYIPIDAPPAEDYLLSGDQIHFVTLGNLAWEGESVAAQVIWSAPPQVFCSNDTINTSQAILNIIDDGGAPMVAELRFFPVAGYATNWFCDAPHDNITGYVTLTNDQSSARDECQMTMLEGPDSSSTVFEVVYRIADRLGSIEYIYAPADSPAPIVEVPAVEVPQGESTMFEIPESMRTTVEEIVNETITPETIDVLFNDDGSLDQMDYTFATETLAPEVAVSTYAVFPADGAEMRPLLGWFIENTGSTAQTVTYTAEIPKSVAAHVDELSFFSDPPGIEFVIVDPDPIIEWSVTVDASQRVMIVAEASRAIALSAAVQNGNVEAIDALREQVSDLVIDIATRRMIQKCSRLTGQDADNLLAAHCVLSVMARYPGNFFAETDCDGAFGDINGDGLTSTVESVYHTACQGILTRSSDPGLICAQSFSEPNASHCRQSIYNAKRVACQIAPDRDLCLYDAAVESGFSAGCSAIGNVDLALACNAYLEQDIAYCQMMVNDTAREVCCGNFVTEPELYAACMGEEVAENPTETPEPTSTPQPVRTEEPLIEGETLTLDEVLIGSTGDADAEYNNRVWFLPEDAQNACNQLGIGGFASTVAEGSRDFLRCQFQNGEQYRGVTISAWRTATTARENFLSHWDANGIQRMEESLSPTCLSYAVQPGTNAVFWYCEREGNDFSMAIELLYGNAFIVVHANHAPNANAAQLTPLVSIAQSMVDQRRADTLLIFEEPQ